MSKARFDVCLSYVVERADGSRDVARTHYPPAVEADDEEQALVVAQERLTAVLVRANMLNEGDTLRIIGGTTNPCVD